MKSEKIERMTTEITKKDKEEIKVQIIEILQQLKQIQKLEQETDLISSGFLDSFDVISLVDSIEKTFQVTIDGADVILDNFDNIDAIVALIERLKS